ncbi:MAG: hypothetical protein QHH75_10095 [Bacillota bacterium]|nr:hypothetical protein [Bacillota bacterium]
MVAGLRKLQEETGKIRGMELKVVPGGKRVEAQTEEYEFPYDDLKLLYDYIRQEFRVQ